MSSICGELKRSFVKAKYLLFLRMTRTGKKACALPSATHCGLQEEKVWCRSRRAPEKAAPSDTALESICSSGLAEGLSRMRFQ